MKFTFGQLVKSKSSGENYRIAKVDDNIYIVESSDRELSYGCDDDFIDFSVSLVSLVPKTQEENQAAIVDL